MPGKKNIALRKGKAVHIAYEDHPMVSLHHAVNQIFDDFFMSFELMPLTEFEELCTFIPKVDMTDDGMPSRLRQSCRAWKKMPLRSAWIRTA
jgi:hypothetical protein